MTLWVPSHQGEVEVFPQRHTALTGRVVRCATPCSSCTTCSPRSSSGPPGQTIDVGVLGRRRRHAAHSPSMRWATRSSRSRQLNAPRNTSVAQGRLGGEQRPEDRPHRELLVHRVGLHVLVVVGRHLLGQAHPPQPLGDPARGQGAGGLERREVAERGPPQAPVQAEQRHRVVLLEDLHRYVVDVRAVRRRQARRPRARARTGRRAGGGGCRCRTRRTAAPSARPWSCRPAGAPARRPGRPP